MKQKQWKGSRRKKEEEEKNIQGGRKKKRRKKKTENGERRIKMNEFILGLTSTQTTYGLLLVFGMGKEDTEDPGLKHYTQTTYGLLLVAGMGREDVDDPGLKQSCCSMVCMDDH